MTRNDSTQNTVTSFCEQSIDDCVRTEVVRQRRQWRLLGRRVIQLVLQAAQFVINLIARIHRVRGQNPINLPENEWPYPAIHGHRTRWSTRSRRRPRRFQEEFQEEVFAQSRQRYDQEKAVDANKEVVKEENEVKEDAVGPIRRSTSTWI